MVPLGMLVFYLNMAVQGPQVSSTGTNVLRPQAGGGRVWPEVRHDAAPRSSLGPKPPRALPAIPRGRLEPSAETTFRVGRRERRPII